MGRLLPLRARLREHPRWRWMALAVVASGMMLSVVNVSIVNIALPQIAADFDVDVPSVSWVVTGFLVTQATLLAIAGRAGDLYGRRRVFVIGVLLLSVGSVLCALPRTPPRWWPSGSSRAPGPAPWRPRRSPMPPSCSARPSAAGRSA